jgi:hypothetical protein
LNADDAHDPTLFCSEGVCQYTTTANGQNTLTDAGLVGGTSVAAPSMAGIQALLNNYNAVNNPEPGNPTGRQGVANYVYYALAAAQSDTTCAASALIPPNDANTTNCAFQDIQVGNTYICGTSTCTSSSGTKIGWPAAVGFDLATGLGSVNAYNMAKQWNSVVFNSTTTSLNPPVQNCTTHGCAVTLSGTVAGSGTPTGDVAFIVSQGEIGDPVNLTTGAFVYPGAFATLSGGSFTATLNNLPAGVNYNITARYGGDGSNASSVSAPQQISVSSEPATITLTPQFISLSACTITNQSTFTYGQLVWVQVSVAGASGYGVPTGTVTITDSINGGPTNNVTTVKLDSNGNGYLVSGNVGNQTNSCLYDYLFAQAPMLIGGSHSLSANYSGDNSFQSGSAGTPATVTISPIATTPTVAAGASYIASGAGDQLTVTFPTVTALTSGSNPQTPGATGPTGTVTFTDTTTLTTLGTATVTPTVIYTAGSSSTSSYPSWTYGAIAMGSVTGITQSGANSITATYSGDSNYIGTTTTAITVTVDPGTGTATTTTVTSSANPTTLRGEPTFTATIAATPTAPTAGTVTFYDATYGTVLGTGSAVGTAHTSTIKLGATPAFVGGTHNIVASYGGTTGATNFTGSTSSALVETVTKGAGSIVLSTKSVGESGETYMFSGAYTPSVTYTDYAPVLGVMTFYDAVNGASPTAIATGVPNLVSGGQGGYGIWNATGSATLSTPGTHVLTAQYVDVNYTSSTSNSVTDYVGNTVGDAGIYFPLGGATLTGATTIFRWFPVAGAQFWLDLGSTPGGNNYLQSGSMGSNLSYTYTNNWPNNGGQVCATLWTLINGSWTPYQPPCYTAATLATIASPTNGASLCSNIVTFTWNAASPTPAGYWIDVGSTPGSDNYTQSGMLSNATLSRTVSGLPTNGSAVYVSLYTEVSSSPVTWQVNTYNYYGTNLDTITTPANSSTLSGTQQTFNWTNTNPSCGDTYWLDISNVAPGDNDVWQSGNLGNVFSTTNPPSNPLPANGSTIYTTLYTINGANVVGYTQDSYTSGP